MKFGEVQREYTKISFDKEMAFKTQAEFVAMGHPLLEAVVNAILTLYAQSAVDGATFFDPEGKKDGIIWFLEAKIQDGKMKSQAKDCLRFIKIEPIRSLSLTQQSYGT